MLEGFSPVEVKHEITAFKRHVNPTFVQLVYQSHTPLSVS